MKTQNKPIREVGPNSDFLLTTKEVAALLKCCIRTVRRLELRDLLHPKRFLRTKRYSHKEVMLLWENGYSEMEAGQ